MIVFAFAQSAEGSVDPVCEECAQVAVGGREDLDLFTVAPNQVAAVVDDVEPLCFVPGFGSGIERAGQ
ncbi:hypothetical protein [Nocardia salmonicida]|uniref:hypothetical protein n=1 Tax=Nocardia salmonicida TaxID=53431 RepID=UPI00342BCDA4